MEKVYSILRTLLIIKSFVKKALDITRKLAYIYGLFMVCLLGYNYFINGVQPTNIQLLIVLLLMLDK